MRYIYIYIYIYIIKFNCTSIRDFALMNSVYDFAKNISLDIMAILWWCHWVHVLIQLAPLRNNPFLYRFFRIWAYRMLCFRMAEGVNLASYPYWFPPRPRLHPMPLSVYLCNKNFITAIKVWLDLFLWPATRLITFGPNDFITTLNSADFITTYRMPRMRSPTTFCERTKKTLASIRISWKCLYLNNTDILASVVLKFSMYLDALLFCIIWHFVYF